MSSGGFLNAQLSKKTSIFGMKLWVLIGLAVGTFIFLILFMLSLWLGSRRKSRRILEKLPINQIPKVLKEIKEVKVDRKGINNPPQGDAISFTNQVNSSKKNSDKVLVPVGVKGFSDAKKSSPGGSSLQQKGGVSQSVDGGSSEAHSIYRGSSSFATNTASPMSGMPEVSYLGWGYWFTLRDLEIATGYFAKENVLGEGGYGIVYKGQLANGTIVAVKNLFNNLGQAEKEFRVEVEAIGRVRHKNLVRLLGYCVEGTHRILVYEYVNNGNLEQWLHGAMRQWGFLTWEARMKIIFGTAKALAYLHEALEPKVVHRDIKSSNILIDHEFNAKVSDFGLAKLLGSGKSHVTTRVMGTFGCFRKDHSYCRSSNRKKIVQHKQWQQEFQRLGGRERLVRRRIYPVFRFFTFLYTTYYGMIMAAATPNATIASILSSACIAVWMIFSGFIIPRPRIPLWWRWYYWACPFAWTLYGLAVSQCGDISDEVVMADGEKQQVNEFLSNYFGYKHDFLGPVAVATVTIALSLRSLH